MAQSHSLPRLAVTGILLVLLALWIKPWNALPTLLDASPALIALALLGVLASLSMNGLVYWHMLRAQKIPFQNVWKSNLYSWLSESFLPGKIGSLAFAFLLQKEGVRFGEGLALVLAYRFSLAGAAFVLAATGLPILFGASIPSHILFLAGSAILVGVALLFVFPQTLRPLLVRVIPAPIREKLGGFSNTLARFATPANALTLLVLAFIQIGVSAGIYTIMFHTAGINVEFLAVLIATAATQLTALIPLTINGIGVREGTMALLLTHAGVPAASSILISGLNTATGYVLVFVLSAYFVKKIPLEEMKRTLFHAKK